MLEEPEEGKALDKETRSSWVAARGRQEPGLVCAALT